MGAGQIPAQGLSRPRAAAPGLPHSPSFSSCSCSRPPPLSPRLEWPHMSQAHSGNLALPLIPPPPTPAFPETSPSLSWPRPATSGPSPVSPHPSLSIQ